MGRKKINPEEEELQFQCGREHLDFFVQECKKWVDFWGLKAWSINYQLLGPADLGEGQAGCLARLEDMQACVALAEDWSMYGEPDVFQLAKVAYHEISELKFYELSEELEKFISEPRARQLIHEQIIREENSIFELYWQENGDDLLGTNKRTKRDKGKDSIGFKPQRGKRNSRKRDKEDQGGDNIDKMPGREIT